MLSFQHTAYLLGLLVLIPLILLFITVLAWKRKSRKALGDEELINELTKNYSARFYKFKFILVLIALALGILAAANLRKPASDKENEINKGIDLIIALDVSKSMLSEDIKLSRLDRAKQCINLLIDKLSNNRIGLVLFAGQAFLQMPLTTDAAAAKMFISNAGPDAVPTQGTVIADALQLSMNSFNNQERKSKAIILITDGEDHDPRTEEIAQQLYDQGIVVHSIGVGTSEGASIMEPGTNEYKRDVEGKVVVSKLNEQDLLYFAKKTGGLYQRLENTDNSVTNIATTIGKMEKTAFSTNGNGRKYVSFYPYFLGICILLLVVEVFIPETKRRKN